MDLEEAACSDNLFERYEQVADNNESKYALMTRKLHSFLGMPWGVAWYNTSLNTSGTKHLTVISQSTWYHLGTTLQAFSAQKIVKFLPKVRQAS